ncbi:PaaX family transcriptional regulator C-terminal domain-containing protein [Angustibacter sp. Root456]|uniref:PaaX family transcriptional regulator n=1 Tax=Angustibacter sp. Root456 TaxID=1736539 RepID=UPI0006F6C4D3|nr:PaaX family transcriptional regulator C-terminal domain-containing protein [Angustibacter sp. Root456]KQX66540.1 PaaX family transcriptional regulator [Angustibacter sp. Root456]
MTIDDREASRPAPPQPRALIVTVYGLYARRTSGWLAVSTLIRLMDDVGVEEPAVRSAISRLKRRGVLVARRRGGVAGYELSPAGQGILAEGDERIFRRTRAGLDDGWLLAVFSVPESERRRRHQLRSRLAWLGFGTVSAGVWVAPAHLEQQTSDVLEREALTAYVDLFRADHVGFTDVRQEVSRWWDLDDLARMYEEFASVHAPVLRRWTRRRTTDDRAAFVDYVTALTAWRRLPYLDPGLPLEVLPRHWPGLRAAAVFDDLRSRLAPQAERHIAQTVSETLG